MFDDPSVIVVKVDFRRGSDGSNQSLVGRGEPFKCAAGTSSRDWHDLTSKMKFIGPFHMSYIVQVTRDQAGRLIFSTGSPHRFSLTVDFWFHTVQTVEWTSE